MIGVIASSLVIGITTLYLHKVFGIGSSRLAAPQATLMATIIKGLLSQNLPWGLVLVGDLHRSSRSSCAASTRCRSPSAPTCRSRRPRPIFAGGLARWYVERKTGETGESEVGSGTLFSSGLIAGGSLAGILYAVLVGTGTLGPFQAIGRFVPFLHAPGVVGQLFGALLFFSLTVILVREAQKKLD